MGAARIADVHARLSTSFEHQLEEETGADPVSPARLNSFTDFEADTREQMKKARTHPWIEKEIPIRGIIFDVHTGNPSEVHD
jgi:carbonic anhydrase